MIELGIGTYTSDACSIAFILRRRTNMTRNLVALWLICISLALAGCNTTAGAGRDIEATGDFIEDSAEDAKDY
jgi:predicted small secreted protein